MSGMSSLLTLHYAVRLPVTRLVLALAGAALVAGLYLFVRSRIAAFREAIVRSERERIAREFHDVLAQGLTGVMLHAEAGLQSVEPGRTLDALRTVKRLARETSVDARRVLFELRREPCDDGCLAETLQGMLATMTEGLPVAAHLTVDGTPRALRTQDAERHLFRIAQEAVTNALRHAGARRIDVALRFETGRVALVVRDDGGGSGAFRLEDLEGGSSGLRGMRERAEAMGARLSIRKPPVGGMEVQVEVDA